MNQQLQLILQQQTSPSSRTNSKAALLPNSLNQPNHHRQYRSVGNVVELKSNSHLQSPKNDASDQSRVLPINASQDLSLTMKNNISSNKLLLEAKTELKKRLQEGIASKRPSRVEEPGQSRRGTKQASPNFMNRYVVVNPEIQQSVSPKLEMPSIRKTPQQFSLRNIHASSPINKNSQSFLNKTAEQEPKEIFTAYLHYNQRKFKLTIDCSKTTDWMMRQLMKVFKTVILQQLEDQKQKIAEPNVVTFNTSDNNYPIDYYLQLEDKPLSVFKDQTINLVPYISDRIDNSQKITIQDFQFIKCIGVGGFSRVYLVRKKSTGKFYAMKLIDKEFIIKNKKQGIVQNERDIMRFLNHPFIIELEWSFESRNFVVFVVPFCCGGELFLQLKQVKRMTEDQARFYFSEICLGMLFLHSLNVVYRDIKPENILIDVDGHVKIADFGLSKPNMGEDEYAYSFCGSPEYMAPEMLLKTGHNVQVDHYCLGALLYELVTGLPPFYSRNTNEIYESILKDELSFPSKVVLTHEIKDLLTKLLIKQPKHRLGVHGGMVEILSHPWFAQINLQLLIQKKIPPPFTPNPMKFTYDSSEMLKGELETREKLLNRAGLMQDVQLFKSFYFDRVGVPSTKGKQVNDSMKAYEHHYMFVCRLQQMNQKPSTQKSTSLTKYQIKARNESPVKPNHETVDQIQEQIVSQSRLKNQQPSIQSRQSKGLKRIISQNNYLLDKPNLLTSNSKIDISSDVSGFKKMVTQPDLLRRGNMLKKD